jgi:predicted TIM-barrel fold metal-dependent hydrolase
MMQQPSAATLALPRELHGLAGRILDVDSHEMMPAQMWIRQCGAVCEPLVQEWLQNGEDVSRNPNHPNCPGFEQDDAPIEAVDIWSRKGSLAPGAVAVRRRDAVMDVMGIKRQLCFPTGVGMWGAFLVMNADDATMLPSIRSGRVEYGRKLVDAYNDWALGVVGQSARVRFVLPALGESVAELLAVAERLIKGGVRALWLPSCLLPGGKSPAHEALDSFWALMEERNITLCLHVGPDQPYRSSEWGNAPVFEGFRLLNEFRVDPWALGANYITTQNFLSTMVVGGVFERHPRLRFGVIETGAYWLGPLCENMDMWYEHSASFGNEKTARLPRRPSDYVRSNVRVSCFDFEPVDRYITRHDLGDVLCFATDYPHVEGGRDPTGRWLSRLQPLGPTAVEKFFVRNAEWLLPE